MVVAELLLAVVAARARIDRTEARTVAEPIPLADIGLAGKEADIDRSSYPLGNYEDSAGCCAPSAQEPSEAPQCRPVVHGEPNALDDLIYKLLYRLTTRYCEPGRCIY